MFLPLVFLSRCLQVAVQGEAEAGGCPKANGIRLRYGAIRLRNYRGRAIGGAAETSFFFFFVGRHLDSGFMDFRAYARPGLSF